jgi:hypothetical protein
MTSIGGLSTPDHPGVTREQPPARDASKKLTAAEALGQAKHGIGLATDHTGHLTGVEGKRFDADLRSPLLHLSIERNAGIISTQQHAEAVAKVLVCRFRFDGQHVVVF